MLQRSHTGSVGTTGQAQANAATPQQSTALRQVREIGAKNERCLYQLLSIYRQVFLSATTKEYVNYQDRYINVQFFFNLELTKI